MIVYAAIDLRQGRVVQLIGGRPQDERLSLPDPVAVAQRFADDGFRALHVVDLDGALEDGDNKVAVEAIIGGVDLPVQVGGGVRDDTALDGWLATGAARVMVGTRAVTDREWLAQAARRHPGRILVAADVRDREVVTHGWTQGSGIAIESFIADAATLPLAGLLVTDVGREGSLQGIDVDLFAEIAAAGSLPIIAAGGIGTLEDLRRLDAAGIAGAVVGTALYTGAIDPGAAAREFTHDQDT